MTIYVNRPPHNGDRVRFSKEPELCATCGLLSDECRLDQVDEWVCPTCADNQSAPIQSAGSAWEPQ